MAEERVMSITHLRDSLGWAYRLVVETDEPIVIQRYKTQDVVMVPAWEWRFLKRVEANIRAGRLPWDDGDEPLERAAVGPTWANVGDVLGDADVPLAQIVQVAPVPDVFGDDRESVSHGEELA